MLNLSRNNIYLSYVLIGAILAYLGSEAIRKYLFNHVFVLLVFDISIVAIFLYLADKTMSRTIGIILIVLALHGLTFSIYYSYPAFAFIAGWREITPILVGFMLGSSRKITVDHRRCLTFICGCITLLTVLSVAQILVGPTHWLNALPSDLEMGSSAGFGSYDPVLTERLGIDLWRPSNVFITTGKYGATIAALTILASTILLLASKRFGKLTLFAVWVFLILSNLVPMQRAFLYPFCLLTIAIIVIYSLSALNREHGAKLVFVVSPPIIAITYVVASGEKITRSIEAIADRLMQFPAEFSQRFNDLSHLETLFGRRPFMGSGFGYYSNYSQLVGGGVYTDQFAGEGGWHILGSNFGFLGLILFFVLSISLIIVRIKILVRTSENQIYLQLFFLFTISLVFSWGFTHNIYAQSFLMFCIFYSIGLMNAQEKGVKS